MTRTTHPQHYAIIADGDFLPKDIIAEAIQNKITIALDTAADKLMKIGITPHYLLGDFDAANTAHAEYWGIKNTFAQLTEEDTPYLGHHGVILVPCKNQQLTDLIKAIHYCDALGALSITLLCTTGGRLDHHECALRALRAEYQKSRPIFLHTDQQTICFAKNESIILKGEIGDKCGILAFPEGQLSSTGLEYDVTDYPLRFAFSESIANALNASRAQVTIQGEALIIMPPQLMAQRIFMRKTYQERLALLLSEASL